MPEAGEAGLARRTWPARAVAARLAGTSSTPARGGTVDRGRRREPAAGGVDHQHPGWSLHQQLGGACEFRGPGHRLAMPLTAWLAGFVRPAIAFVAFPICGITGLLLVLYAFHLRQRLPGALAAGGPGSPPARPPHRRTQCRRTAAAARAEHLQVPLRGTSTPRPHPFRGCPVSCPTSARVAHEQLELPAAGRSGCRPWFRA
jgi:hypothetical protein